MARITDTERGARIALDVADRLRTQYALFPDGLHYDFWEDIADAAADQLAECQSLRAAMSDRVE